VHLDAGEYRAIEAREARAAFPPLGREAIIALMAVSASFLEYVLEQLAGGRRDIAHKRMFGGIGIYADERFVALLDNDRLFLKADDSNRPDFEREGCAAFQPYGEGSYSMSYFEVPPSVLEDRDELDAWIGRSWIAAEKKAKPRKAAVIKPKSATPKKRK
jgi:DNA transformation protein and related proteins